MVGNWFKTPQGTSRFIEVSKGILEASDQENHNTVLNHMEGYTPIIENDTEEQSTEEIQENQEQVTAPSTNYVVTVSGRASQPPAHLIKEMGEAALTTAEQNCYFVLSGLKE